MLTPIRTPILLLATIALTACGGNAERYLLPEVSMETQRQSAAGVIVVGPIDLPSYVRDIEINIQDQDGVLRPAPNGFWADDPTRALTELLADALDQSLNAVVASDPLPGLGLADLRVDVKVRRFVGKPGQTMELKGQYFLTAPKGGRLQKIERFEITVPLPTSEVKDYATAQSRAITLLSNQISASISGVRRSQL